MIDIFAHTFFHIINLHPTKEIHCHISFKELIVFAQLKGHLVYCLFILTQKTLNKNQQKKFEQKVKINSAVVRR